MSLVRNDRYLLPKITDTMIAKRVSEALRQEHANVHAAVKQIERITGISAMTARHWYDGIYAPKSRHLLMLAVYYPQVLYAVCEMMSTDPMLQHGVDPHAAKAMQSHLEKQWDGWKKPESIGDKSVTIRVRVDRHYAGQMNQLQLWFLGQLQQGHEIHANDLVTMWGVHIRTAKRDISGLLESKLVMPERLGRKCSYRVFGS